MGAAFGYPPLFSSGLGAAPYENAVLIRFVFPDESLHIRVGNLARGDYTSLRVNNRISIGAARLARSFKAIIQAAGRTVAVDAVGHGAVRERSLCFRSARGKQRQEGDYKTELCGLDLSHHRYSLAGRMVCTE